MQRERPFDIIRLLHLDEVTLRWRQSGYSLFVGGRRIGFVRYNVRDTHGHLGLYAVYVTMPFSDPHEIFENCHADEQSGGHVCFVDPDDRETIDRVVDVLRSAALS